MSNNTYDSILELSLSREPEEIDDPKLYQEFLALHDAIEALANYASDLNDRLIEEEEEPVTDYFQEVAAGRVPGSSTISKFGENPDIDIVSGFETIWDAGGTYVPPTTARIHDAASDNAVDIGTLVSSGIATSGSITSLVDTSATFIADGVALLDRVLNDSTCEIGVVTAVVSQTEITMITGIRNADSGVPGTPIVVGDAYRIVTNGSTGAAVLYVKGTSAARIEINEFLLLNGTTNVPTLKSYIRQYRARVFGPNITGAVGTITSTAQIDGTISCQVINGNNQTLMAVYTVPLGKTAYIHQWWGSISKKQTAISNMILRGGILDGIGYIIQNRSITTSGSSEFSWKPSVPIQIPGGADIWVEADTDTNNTGIASGFDVILEDVVV